jgi:DNA-directed RNA polymerase specialized sigma24 family protein
VWRSLPSFRGDSKAATWLYRVAVNTALTWQRRMKRHDNGQVPLEPVLVRISAESERPFRLNPNTDFA